MSTGAEWAAVSTTSSSWRSLWPYSERRHHRDERERFVKLQSLISNMAKGKEKGDTRRTGQIDVATQGHQERRQGRPHEGQRSEAGFQHVHEEAVPAEASFAFCWRPSGVLRFPEWGLQARSVMPVLAHVRGVRHRQALQRMRLRQRQPDTLNIVSIRDHSDLTNCSTRDFADAPLGLQHVDALWVTRVSG